MERTITLTFTDIQSSRQRCCESNYCYRDATQRITGRNNHDAEWGYYTCDEHVDNLATRTINRLRLKP
jgi:hypothetical protein